MIQILNKRIPLLLLALCIAVGTLSAQDDYASEKKLITKVKRSPETYIYAEATCKTLEEAQAVAEEMFYQNVNEYVAQQKKLRQASEVVINDPKAQKSEVSMPRGTNMYRCFIYVKKKDIIGVNNSVVIENTSQSKVEKAEEQPKSTTPATPKASAAPHFPKAASELAGITTVAEINDALKRMYASGLVTAYDKYKNLQAKEEWYLILYNAQGKIGAILSDGATRYNVASGKEDSIKNYPQHAALGVKFKP